MPKKRVQSTKLKATTKLPIPVDAIKHKDARVNIPTEELRDFVARRRGGADDAALSARPVARPAARLEGQGRAGPRRTSRCRSSRSTSRRRSTRRRSSRTCATRRRPARTEPELTLFADFNGIDDFDKKVDFYRHDQHWSNRMILGDSLLVMTSLAEKEGLKGKVQMIYFDPPYGIKFGVELAGDRRASATSRTARSRTRRASPSRSARSATRGSSASTRTSPTCATALTVARELLTETGSVFVQIGDENVHLVRSRPGRGVRQRELRLADRLRRQPARQLDGELSCRALLTTCSGTQETASAVKYRQLYSEKDAIGDAARRVRVR